MSPDEKPGHDDWPEKKDDPEPRDVPETPPTDPPPVPIRDPKPEGTPAGPYIALGRLPRQDAVVSSSFLHFTFE